MISADSERSVSDAYNDFGDMLAAAVKAAGYKSPAFNGVILVVNSDD